LGEGIEGEGSQTRGNSPFLLNQASKGGGEHASRILGGEGGGKSRELEHSREGGIVVCFYLGGGSKGWEKTKEEYISLNMTVLHAEIQEMQRSVDFGGNEGGGYYLLTGKMLEKKPLGGLLRGLGKPRRNQKSLAIQRTGNTRP